MRDEREQYPSSPAAPVHNPEPPFHGLDDDDERIIEPPSVKIMGQPLSRVLIVGLLLAGFVFGVGQCISYSRSEMKRAGKEIAPALSR